MKRILLLLSVVGGIALSAHANEPPRVITGGEAPLVLYSCPNGVTTAFTVVVGDDGLPSHHLASTWTVVSGNVGAVQFLNPNFPQTSVTFHAPGTYLLLLSATDGEFTSTGTLAVIVQPHRTPLVEAGPDQTIFWSKGDGDTDDFDHAIWQAHFGTTPNDERWYAPADINRNGVVDTADETIWRNNLGSTIDYRADIDYRGNADLTGRLTNGEGVSWSKVSGPGFVIFLDSTSVITGATFSSTGTYVLALTTLDCGTPVTDQLIVRVEMAPNQRPGVSASVVGSLPAELSCSDGAMLEFNGHVKDDGLPYPPSLVNITWSVVSGNASTVQFVDRNAINTKATFFSTGTFLIGLSANDGEFTSTTTVTVDIISLPPVTVNAGPDQSIPWSLGDGDVDEDDRTIWRAHFGTMPGQESWYSPADINGNGVVDAADQVIWRNAAWSKTDLRADIDYGAKANLIATLGRPLPFAWRKVSGPGIVNFMTSTQAVTMATFGSTGTYVLELSVVECGRSIVDTVIVRVGVGDLSPTPGGFNLPTVSAGPDIEVFVNTRIQLNGAVFPTSSTPLSALTRFWRMVSGPAGPLFEDRTVDVPTASFPVPGSYVLAFEVSDGTNTVQDQMNVTALVEPGQSSPIGDNPINVITPPINSVTFPVTPNQSGDAVIKVYDHTGDLITTLFDGFLTAGLTQNVTWNGHNDQGHGVGSGMYIIFFDLPGQTIKTKIIVSR